MTVRADMTNGHGNAHGGFIFSLADSAFAFACNSRNERAVAQACDIVFAAPARLGDRLVATATERHRFGRNGIYDIRVTKDVADGPVVAEFRGRSRVVSGIWVRVSTRRRRRRRRRSDDDAGPVHAPRPLGRRRAAVRRRAPGDPARPAHGHAHPRARERARTTPRRSTPPGVHPDDLHDLSDLSGFPFTSKADLRDNYPFGMFAVPREEVVRVHASSGTTGRPTVVGYTATTSATWSDVMARSIRAAGGRRATCSTWRTGTACSPADSARTTAPSGSVAPSSRSAAG